MDLLRIMRVVPDRLSQWLARAILDRRTDERGASAHHFLGYGRDSSSDDCHLRYAVTVSPVQIKNAGTIRISIAISIPGI